MTNYKDSNYVKDLSGVARKLVGIDKDKKEVVLWMRINAGTLECEMRPFRGHVFFCHTCDDWHKMDELALDTYPDKFVCIK